MAKLFIVALLLLTGGLFVWSLVDLFLIPDGSAGETAFVVLTAGMLATNATSFAPTRSARVGAMITALALLVAFFLLTFVAAR
jgi:hypothetical protein